ncbi:MAG: hypothetical protein QXJ68_02210 [Methanocellales archaeon]
MNVEKDGEGQMILLSAFIMLLSLLLITILLNDVILTSNIPGTGLYPSKQHFKSLQEMTIREARNAVLKANKTSSDFFNSTFHSYFNSYVNATTLLYAARGEAVEIHLDYLNQTLDYLNLTLVYQDGILKLEEKIKVDIYER